MDYTQVERARAIAWKQATGTLPETAQLPAPYRTKFGTDGPEVHDFYLPAEHAALSLLPEVRDGALALFAELGIAGGVWAIIG